MGNITVEKQEEILAEKLNKRTENVILADKNTPNFEMNRAILISLCQDPITGFQFFCDNFCWLQDPQATDVSKKELPFLLYEYQVTASDEIIKAISKGYDLPIEKSRKMGLSWLLIAILVWGWHFHQWDSLLGSQTAAKVDKKGDMDSLFEKARYLCSRLPEWIMPRLIDKQTDKNKLLIHPIHQSKISGESNNSNFGRAGRNKVVLFDEFASWECTDRAAWQSCGMTANCRIPLSTPNPRGINCFYYTIVQNAKKKQLPCLTLHWVLNPVFAKGLYETPDGKPHSPWYDAECKRAVSQLEISQELDINYSASMVGKVFPDFKLEQIDDNLEYDENLPLYLGWDWGLDSTALIWFQTDGSNIYIIDEYQNDGKGAGSDILHYINVIEDKGYKAALHYGDPHSGENRQLAASGNSNASIMRRHGLIVKTIRSKIDTRIGAGKNILSNITIAGKCILTIEMFISWQLSVGGVPKHDQFSHLGDAFSYFAINFKDNKNRNKSSSSPRKNYKNSTSGSVY